MRTSTITSSLLAVALCATASSAAFADDHHDRDRGRDHDRGDNGHRVVPHPAYTRTPGFRAHVRFDPRPAYVVHNDPHYRVVVRGYHPHHAWGRYHLSRGGWFHTWGVASWNDVGTVTCEAVNQDTGQMYPVSEERDDIGWNNGTVNALLDRALDECYQDGGGAACAPVTPSCTVQR